MPELMVALDDGTTALLRDCEWVFYEPCGCPCGVIDAVCAGWALYDEEVAWREFFDAGLKRKTAAAVKQARERGVRAELMTVERYRAEVNPAMRVKCAHRTEAVSAP